MRRVGKIIVVTAAAVALGACSPSNEEPSDLPPGTDPTPSQQVSAPASTSPPTASPAQGPACTAEDIEVSGDFGQDPEITIPDDCAPPQELVSEDLVEGDGPEAKAGSTVKVNYELQSWSGSESESSFESGQTFDLHLGSGEVIQGWDEGLVGIKEGGRRLLVVPPALGYGGQPGHPLANEALVFVVDAEKVTPA